MIVVVSYDISCNKRRKRARNLLKSYGDPVQRSVFECPLDQERLSALKKEIKTVIDDDDSVIYYPLCGKCVAQRSETVTTERPSQKRTVVV